MAMTDETTPAVQPRKNDPQRTVADIIAVATREFAEFGFSGARVDRIAAQTNTSKRMIYYYFNSKEGLYREVLYAYYAQLRQAEDNLNLASKPPLTAITELVRFTFQYHVDHADIVRLVMVENIHKGRHITAMPSIDPLNSTIIDSVAEICRRGAADGVMRPDLDPVDLYMSIAALCFFNVSNRHTFSTIFHRDMTSPEALEARLKSITRMVVRFVTV
jgi:AcrR family transcriptional regulator